MSWNKQRPGSLCTHPLEKRGAELRAGEYRERFNYVELKPVYQNGGGLLWEVEYADPKCPIPTQAQVMDMERRSAQCKPTP